jgi:hypothetical protein
MRDPQKQNRVGAEKKGNRELRGRVYAWNALKPRRLFYDILHNGHSLSQLI